MTQIVQFEPINDQVVVKMDVKKKSAILIDTSARPTVIPSGEVVAVGRGTFVPGTGFVETQVKPGDHVAVSMDGSWVNLPLSDDKEEIFIAVSESLILGKIAKPADMDWAKTPWFTMGDDAASQQVVPVSKRR